MRATASFTDSAPIITATAFAGYIEETGSPVSGGKIWTVEYQPLKHPDTSNSDDALNLLNKVFIGTSQDLLFSLANAPSGQNLFLMFTTANPTVVNDGGILRITDPTIIATGKDPADQSSGANITTGDTINTSQAGGPTTFGTNNQMIVEQEGIRFTFVTGARQDLTIPNLDQNEADIRSSTPPHRITTAYSSRTGPPSTPKARPVDPRPSAPIVLSQNPYCGRILPVPIRLPKA
ncbi:hypothetical protein PsasTeo6_09304 [Pseudomonas asiatica]|nr:hypothetical protein PsasTeo6_09304 [Pseudomonas asiatica]